MHEEIGMKNDKDDAAIDAGSTPLLELQHEIHDALRAQHPDWVGPDGDCPTCESYELRLAELLGLSSDAKPPYPN
jgi:hypothetical protein